MTSYSQNFEDVTIARALGLRKDGFYIDVGASHPVVGSVTKLFYDMGWSGINIEPVERFHRLLFDARPRDTNLCLALGKENAALDFFEFDAEGISTLDPEFADHFAGLGYACRRRSVEVTSLAAICDKHKVGTIDFLKIDVEGWERQVLEGGDWKRFRPIILVIEATRPNSPTPNWDTWEPFVFQLNYRFAYYDGLNRYYVDSPHAHLLRRFPSFAVSLLRAAYRGAPPRLKPFLKWAVPATHSPV